MYCVCVLPSLYLMVVQLLFDVFDGALGEQSCVIALVDGLVFNVDR